MTQVSMPNNSVLLRTSDVLFGASRCDLTDAETEVEETEKHHTLVFPVEGVFSVDTGSNLTSATPSKVLFFRKGQTHRVLHPYGANDRSFYFSLSQRIIDPFIDAEGGFPPMSAFTQPSFDFRLIRLVNRAARRELTRLELDEFVLHTLTHSTGESLAPSLHSNQHRQVAIDADEHLALHFQEDCDLAHVASDVGVSPHHLSRVFKAVTGRSLTRRRTQLRLLHALEQIVSGADDLSMVAVEAGFYDHSHMANSFRAHLGVSPSMARIGAVRPMDLPRTAAMSGA
ncbi:MAG: AraC family transcriptional regulator [Acidimicrobiia bacterium]